MDYTITNFIIFLLVVVGIYTGYHTLTNSKPYRARVNRKIDLIEQGGENTSFDIFGEQHKISKQELLVKAERAKHQQQLSLEEKAKYRSVTAKLDEGEFSDCSRKYSDLREDVRAILEEFAAGKKYCILPAGERRDSVMMNWLKYSGKKKALIVTSSKKANSIEDAAKFFDKYCGEGSQKQFDTIEIISWNDLASWYHEHSKKCVENPECCICEYAIAFDEVHYAKSGNSCERGMAFLNICEEMTDWIGLSAEMGNNWGGYTTFFVATKIFENSSDFEEKYAYYTYMPNGDKFIAGYSDTHSLLKMWNGISVAYS